MLYALYIIATRRQNAWLQLELGSDNTANLKIPPYEIFDLTTHGFGPHLQAKQ